MRSQQKLETRKKVVGRRMYAVRLNKWRKIWILYNSGMKGDENLGWFSIHLLHNCRGLARLVLSLRVYVLVCVAKSKKQIRISYRIISIYARVLLDLCQKWRVGRKGSENRYEDEIWSNIGYDFNCSGWFKRNSRCGTWDTLAKLDSECTSSATF